MINDISWPILLFLFSGIQGVILALMFLIDYNNTKKFQLGLYLLFFSLVILQYTAYWHTGPEAHSIINLIGNMASWSLPALFFCYVSDSKIRFNQYLVHAVPAIFFLFYWLAGKYQMLSYAFFQASFLVLPIIQIALFVGYGMKSWRHITFEKSDHLIVFGYVGILLGLIFYFLSNQFGFYTLKMDYIICGVFIILTYGTLYISQINFMRGKSEPSYATSSLTEEEGKQVLEKIHHELLQRKVYRRKDFNLSELSNYINVPKYRISQALNKYSQSSFTEIVNNYRVQEAREMLESVNYRHIKVEAIGEEVGFNNKVTFYSQFKKHFGVSPGQVRQEAIAQISD